MQAIETGLLVSAWERGQAQHPLYRALTLLQVASPDQTIGGLARLTVGERDRRLLELRQKLFGSQFEAVAGCPHCQEKLDVSFSASQLPAASEPAVSVDVAVGSGAIAVRLPNTIDLLEVVSAEPERREMALLERCAGTNLSGSAAETVQAKMAEMDPMAQVEMDLTCPACRYVWTSFFDIASYLWQELNDHVIRLFRETHALARTYGWREADIFGMTPRRRRIYLNLAAGIEPCF